MDLDLIGILREESSSREPTYDVLCIKVDALDQEIDKQLMLLVSVS
jgi:hypothetical protein